MNNKEKKSIDITTIPDLADAGDIISELHKMIIEDFPDLFEGSDENVPDEQDILIDENST